MKKLGLVLGRFQPLHLGHINLLDVAFKENDIVVICIGSAQKKDPLDIRERSKRIKKQLKIMNKKNYKIVELIDPHPISIWPSYVKEKCGITDKTSNTFYRAQNDIKEYMGELKRLGFKVKILKKVYFYYRAPDKQYYKVSSATEIKAIHKRLNAMKDL